MSSSPPTSPAATNGEEPLVKKQKKNPQIPSLPDDLILSCLARVSRLHYPTLSLVSKSFRSLLASPELYKTRSLLTRTESCLNVCLQRSSSDPNPHWFTLCLKPNQTQNSSCNLLVPILIPSSPPQAHEGSVVAVDSKDSTFSSNVRILDCQCHDWRKALNILVERGNAAANVFDGKVYVAGGCQDCNSSNWMEVFDPKNQTWEPVLSPLAEIYGKPIKRSGVSEGEFYMFRHFGFHCVAYKPKEDSSVTLNMLMVSYCVIGNVLYCYCWLNGIICYDFQSNEWRWLKGLEGLPKLDICASVRLVDYGGKIAILWDGDLPSCGYQNKGIWCAVIALERRDGGEIWGKFEWLDVVLKVSESYEFVCAVAVTV